MKRWILVFSLLTAGMKVAQALPSAGSVGAGVVVGDPIGPTIKYWTSSKNAVQIGLGFEDDFVIYGDFLWEMWDIFNKPAHGSPPGVYFGLGPRFEDVDNNDDNKFGIRTVAGINYFLDRHPIELYLEVAPVFQVSPDTDVDVDAGVGVRFYFN